MARQWLDNLEPAQKKYYIQTYEANNRHPFFVSHVLKAIDGLSLTVRNPSLGKLHDQSIFWASVFSFFFFRSERRTQAYRDLTALILLDTKCAEKKPPLGWLL